MSALISFVTFPVCQKFTYTQLVFGSIAFKLFNLGQTFRVAFHNLPTISWGSEFWPIPPDRAGVTESGLEALLTHTFSVLLTHFLWD